MTVLARRADANGASYPGIGTICADTKVSRRKVISSIQRLEAEGLIQKRKQRRGNGFDRNHYTVKLTPPGSAPDAPLKAKSSAPETLPKPGPSAPDAPRVVHEMHLGSAQGTLEVTHEVTHTSNPSSRRSKNSETNPLTAPLHEYYLSEYERIFKARKESVLPANQIPKARKAFKEIAEAFGNDLDQAQSFITKGLTIKFPSQREPWGLLKNRLSILGAATSPEPYRQNSDVRIETAGWEPPPEVRPQSPEMGASR